MLKHFSSILYVFGCVYICVPNVSDAFGVQRGTLLKEATDN